MSFALDNVIIDRITSTIAEDTKGNLLYRLTQLQDAKIETSAESKEAKDANGTLVKKFWTGKAGTFSATSAMLSLNIVAAKAGTKVVRATSAAKIRMPKIVDVVAGTASIQAPGLVEGTVHVASVNGEGAIVEEFKFATTASATQFAVDAKAGTPVITLPTVKDTAFVVKYMRDVENGTAVYNKSTEFPKTVRLTSKALAVSPCNPDMLRGLYIVCPSFQPSPETSLALATDGTIEFNGDLQVDYCSGNKTLYELYWADDDEEE